MLRSIVKTATATVLYAAVHSLLASRPAKDAAARLMGTQRRNAWYRPFYVAQALVTTAGLALYIKHLPTRELYRVRGSAAGLLRLAQLGSLLYGYAAARQIGIADLLGVPGVKAFQQSAAHVPPEPEAQGPRLGDDGRMRATGPFRFSRHPLNFMPIPFFWLNPRMTDKLLTFNLLATAYFVLGSMHEEHRLKLAYGEAYEAYRRSGVPFYVPRLVPSGLPERPSATLAAKPTAAGLQPA